MIGSEERRRLISRFYGESTTPLAVVLKCAVGILLLVIIAAGSLVFSSPEAPTAAIETYPAPQVGRVIAQSKRVFDERRRIYDAARHAGAAEASNATRAWIAVE